MPRLRPVIVTVKAAVVVSAPAGSMTNLVLEEPVVVIEPVIKAIVEFPARKLPEPVK